MLDWSGALCLQHDAGVELLRRSPVVHTPELDRAPAPSFEADDHVQLLPILRAEVVFGHLPSTETFRSTMKSFPCQRPLISTSPPPSTFWVTFRPSL